MAFRTVNGLCQLAIALHATVLPMAPALAQRARSARPDIGVSAGLSPYDLSGTGTGFAGGVWLGIPLRPFLLAEGGFGYFRYTAQGETVVAYLLPEIGLRVGAPLGHVFPYFGGGAGYAHVITGSVGTDRTLHVALGIRAWVSSRVGLRGEGRLRSVDPWAGNMVDLTAGVLIRL